MLELFTSLSRTGRHLSATVKISGRSTTGVICVYSGGAIRWLSQRQMSVAISTTKAEIVAASEAAREVMWLKRFLNGIVGLEGIPEILLTMKRLFD